MIHNIARVGFSYKCTVLNRRVLCPSEEYSAHQKNTVLIRRVQCSSEEFPSITPKISYIASDKSVTVLQKSIAMLHKG